MGTIRDSEAGHVTDAWQNFPALFDASLVVPIGPDNAPKTKSNRWWRRVI